MTQFQQSFGNRYVQRVMDRVHAADRPDADLAQRIQAASSDGSALDATLRNRLAASLGADVSGVRVHTDRDADELSREVSAIAFTTGPDIFFREGTYQPETPGGLRLIAHEAAHTLQQANGPVDGTPIDQGVSISDPADSFEQAAEQAANQVIAGHGAAPSYQNTTTNDSSQKAVQRTVWNSDTSDIENDFWGTKSILGQKWGGVADAAISSAWDIAGAAPGIGTPISLIGAGIDAGKAAYTGGGSYGAADNGNADDAANLSSASTRFKHDAALAALGAIPGWGTVQGLAEAAVDVNSVIDRVAGGNNIPLSGDIWDAAWKSDDQPKSKRPVDLGNVDDQPKSKPPVDLGNVEDWPESKPPVDLGNVEDWPESKSPVDLGNVEDWPESKPPVDLGNVEDWPESNPPPVDLGNVEEWPEGNSE